MGCGLSVVLLQRIDQVELDTETANACEMTFYPPQCPILDRISFPSGDSFQQDLGQY